MRAMQNLISQRLTPGSCLQLFRLEKLRAIQVKISSALPECVRKQIPNVPCALTFESDDAYRRQGSSKQALQHSSRSA